MRVDDWGVARVAAIRFRMSEHFRTSTMKSDSAMISCIENFPVPASLKEADTGRYVVNNVSNSRQFGVEDPVDLVGLRIQDVKFFLPKWGKSYANMIKMLDFRVCEEKSHVLGKHHFLDHSGEVQLEEMVKFPVLGSKKNVLGIVTYRNDITSTLSPIGLYQLYKRFYDTGVAIERVLACLGVDRYFDIDPTDAQLRVFLLRAERLNGKEIARVLGISDRTVECHLSALRNKVSDGNLPNVLSALKWSPSCVQNSIHF